MDDELGQLFCEVNLGPSKSGNTIYHHALLLESLVPLFTTIWSATQNIEDILSLALEEEGDGGVQSERVSSQGLALRSSPDFIYTLLHCTYCLSIIC